MEVKLSVVGIEQIDDLIKGLPTVFQHSVLQNAHAEAAKPLIYKEHLLAPVGETGKTADSIGLIKPPFSKASVSGEVQAGPRRGKFGGNVAHLSEFGTKPRFNKSGAYRGIMPKHPFVTPAWEQTHSEVEDKIAVALSQKLLVFMKKTIKNANG